MRRSRSAASAASLVTAWEADRGAQSARPREEPSRRRRKCHSLRARVRAPATPRSRSCRGSARAAPPEAPRHPGPPCQRGWSSVRWVASAELAGCVGPAWQGVGDKPPGSIPARRARLLDLGPSPWRRPARPGAEGAKVRPRSSVHGVDLAPYVHAVLELGEHFADLRMLDRIAGIDHQVLLGHVGDVIRVLVLGEQMIERLVLARPDLLGDRLVPLLGIAEPDRRRRSRRGTETCGA